ncbi:MAG TPA: universal stress protein [Ktedonobacterales bacterium]|nr:universal stress protein [Ktedonobacterales bacterium]
MDTAHDNATGEKDQMKPEESLPPFVAYQVEEESRDNAPASSGSAGEHYRHGRVEAETKRVSDEVTREAQQRLRAAQANAQIAAPVRANGLEQPTPTSLKRLLVPLDGDASGERALPYVAKLSRLLGADLLLAHVTATEAPPWVGRVLHLPESERQQAQQTFAPDALPYLQQVQQALMAPGRMIDTLHTTATSVAEGLLHLEKSRDIDLVVLALRPHLESDHAQVGRVADNLIRSGKAPVLVIPPEADAASHPFALRHIVVALDGSDLAEKALGPLASLLAQLRAAASELPDVTLLAVADDFTILPDYESYLDALHGSLVRLPEFAGVRLRTKVIVGSAPGAIVGAVEYDVGQAVRDDAAAELPVDLLVMTTHGRGGMSRWLFGSVADYVLPRVQTPVLLIRPAASEFLA